MRLRLAVVALLTVSCGGASIPDPAGFALCVSRCTSPGFCAHGAEGWACITPVPTPSPTATPTPSPTPRPWPANPAYCGAEPFPKCDCYQTASARANLCTYVWCDGVTSDATCPRTCVPPEVLSPNGNCVLPSPPHGYACDPACAPGERCERAGRCGGNDCFSCYPAPAPTPTPVPTPSPTPAPTPTPCIPTTGPCVTRTEVVCFGSGPNPDGSQDPDIGCNTLPLGEKSAWSCQDIRDYMLKRVRQDDGTLAAPHWSGPINGLYYNDPDNDASRRQWYRAEDCSKVRPDGTLIYPMGHATGHFPYRKKVTREVCPAPVPCPSPTPTPGPTPTPAPGCPELFKVGGMFLSATDCGQNCRKQGYLGVRVNYTATELCKEGDPGCVCDPARNRCEMPRQCQNPNGADTFITLQGHFTNDECDRNSDNYFNCHHKPKKAETGVTLFTSTPWQEPKNPWDSRGVTNCVDVQEHGTRQLARDSQACKDALAAAGR